MAHGHNCPLIGITMSRDGSFLRLREEYPRAVQKARGMPVPVTFDVDPSWGAELLDGLVIPGGGDIDPSCYRERGKGACHQNIVPRDKTEFEISLLREMIKQRKPVLGICYGMQLINVAFGGTLYGDIAEEFGAAIDHKRGDHRVEGTVDILRGSFSVNSSHHQAVKMLGGGLSVCARSVDGLIEAVRLDDYPFLMGVQWHPERSEDRVSRDLFRALVDHAS